LIINIVDVGLGNVCSIEHWLSKCSLISRRVKKVEDFSDDAIIIPGVASAGEFMKRLNQSGMDKEIIKRAKKKQKIIGICLGFQILTNFSAEDGGVKCLGLLKGQTKYLKDTKTNNGWYSLSFDTRKITNSVDLPIKNKKKLKGRVYFNHELRVDLETSKDLYISNLSHGITSYAFMGNIFGFQFHPEKSQSTGTELLKLII
jgi:glutamine amidotransferase